MADRLTGEDEESIRKDAESLAKLLGGGQPQRRQASPMKDTEGGSGKNSEMRSMLQDLRGE